MTDISAPIFEFGEHPTLTVHDAHTRALSSEGQLALTGPSVTAEPGHLPVRGDLAHIKLAGRYFVPHYAAPMPHTVTTGGATLHKASSPESEVVATLPEAAIFDVLDMAGDWAWGQFGDDGPVGYVRLAQLEATGP